MEFRQFVEKTKKEEVTGIFQNIPDDVYRLIPYLSQTELKEFMISPAHAREWRLREEKRRPSVPWLLHIALLEPERWSKVVHVSDRRTKANKASIERAEADGRIVCTTKEFKEVKAIKAMVTQKTRINEILDQSLKEVVALGCEQTKDGSIMLKGRFDLLHGDKIYDVKTISRGMLAKQYLLSKVMIQRGWHIQAAYYSKLFHLATGKNCDYGFIFVEDKPPYESKIVDLGVASVDKAMELVNTEIQRYQICKKEDQWDGYPDDYQQFEVPDYAWGDQNAYDSVDEYELEGEYHE